MNVRTLWRSFAGGEITPELFGRLDLAKFQTGLKTARNFIILPHGPAANRSGTEYVLEVKDSSKHTVLIPFIYSTTQAYVLEFGDQYMRIHTAGATVLEAAQTITSATNANPGVFTKVAHGLSTGQWIYWTGVTGMSQLNGRFMKVVKITNDTFSLTDLAGTAFNTTSLGTYTAGNAARVYEIATPYLEADLFDLHYTQSADVLTIVHPTYQQRELKRLGATNWTLTTFTLAPTIAAPTSPTSAIVAGAGTISYTYVCTAIAADGLEESVASATTTVINQNLSGAGASNSVQCTVGADAVRFNVYKQLNGLFGYIGQAVAGGTFIDDNITPDLGKTPPEANDPFVGAGNYPGAVGYFQGRRWFAGTTNKPQNVWATRSGTEKNLTYSIPTRDDDSIAIRLTARQNNTIRHIVPLKDLLLLTSGAEWQITTKNSDVITPTSIDYTPQDYIGSANACPVVTSSAVLYAQDRGGRVREMRFAWEQSGYKTADVSIMAPHLFDNYTIASMTYARAPFQTLWAIRSDGTLMGLTYVPEHEVVAWHHHDTDGTFESVMAVPEGNEDATYVVVKRTVNSRTVRYVERFHTRRFDTLADAFFVDAGLAYNGSSATVISGLWHLEGKTVSILADGAVQPQQAVSNGAVTLQQAASKVMIGLPITADLETLPLILETQAFGQALRKNVNKVYLRVYRSSGIFVGPSFDKLREDKQRTTEPYGSPPDLKTGFASVLVTPTWGYDAGICVRQSAPLPVTVLGIVPDTAVGG